MPILLVLFLLAGGCAGRDDGERVATQRERDSVVGASKLPGASGVRGALRAADSANARHGRLDSVGP